MSNKEWLDKCLIAADKLYSIFPFEVLEEMYGEPLDKDEAINRACIVHLGANHSVLLD